MIKELDCIICPMSCHLEVALENDEIQYVKGNTCPRGDVFARQEVICPMRMVTTTVRIHNALHPVLPVILTENIAKDKIFDIIKTCKNIEVSAPVQMGQLLVHNIAGSGADLVASRSMEMRK